MSGLTGVVRVAGKSEKQRTASVTEEGAVRVVQAVRIETDPINLDIDTTAAVTDPIDTAVIRISTDQDCLILQGTDPEITSTNGFIHLAGQSDYHHTPGDKVAILKLSATGIAQIVGVSF